LFGSRIIMSIHNWYKYMIELLFMNDWMIDWLYINQIIIMTKFSGLNETWQYYSITILYSFDKCNALPISMILLALKP